jgi:hypothetical protein
MAVTVNTPAAKQTCAAEQPSASNKASAAQPPSSAQNSSTLKPRKLGAKMTYTVDGVLETWNDASDYGIRFRALSTAEQLSEVQVLNKGADKGMKGLMKMKLLATNYKSLLADKMREHLSGSIVPPIEMFQCVPKTTNVLLNPSFISVGEWVEVDADRRPGFNSEGGIAVVINVHDDFSDVKYVLTKWVEKLVPLRRLTTITMPHRGPRASLRKAKVAVSPKTLVDNVSSVSEFRRMSAIQILKYGLSQNLWKKKGWLFELLKTEGVLDGSKQSRKEFCWQYYKSQMLYIEAMRDAKEDEEFDPRRSDYIIGKDGRFIKSKKGTDKPKNPLTVTYLCNAFGVPYATFKRWKIDGFLTEKQVPVNKGKCILTDPKWAQCIANPRKMYVSHSLAMWAEKHPSKKYDAPAKKVMEPLFQFRSMKM